MIKSFLDKGKMKRNSKKNVVFPVVENATESNRDEDEEDSLNKEEERRKVPKRMGSSNLNPRRSSTVLTAFEPEVACDGHLKILNLVCLSTLLYSGFLYPFVIIFNNFLAPGTSWIVVALTLVSNFFISAIFFLESFYIIRKQTMSRCFLTSELLMLIATGIPFGLLFYGSRSRLLIGIGLSMNWLRILKIVPYTRSIFYFIRSVVQSPRPQLARLAMVLIFLIIAMNLFGGFYFVAGSLMWNDDILTWVDIDLIRVPPKPFLANATEERLANISTSLQFLQYSRSSYFLIQTALLIGYGDIAPIYYPNFIFVCFYCIGSLFLFGIIVANINSLFLYLNLSAALHRSAMKVVYKIMSKYDMPASVRYRISLAGNYSWTNYSGLSRKTLLDYNFPCRVLDWLQDEDIKALHNLRILYSGTSASEVFRPAGEFVLQNCTRMFFEAGEPIVNIYSPEETYKENPCLIVILSGRAIATDKASHETVMESRDATAQSNVSKPPAPRTGQTLWSKWSQKVHDIIAIETSSSSDDGEVSDDRTLQFLAEEANSSNQDGGIEIILKPGDVIHSGLFFLADFESPRRYRALKKCEALFLYHSDLRQLSFRFPELQLTKLCQYLETEKCPRFDSRVAWLLGTEKALKNKAQFNRSVLERHMKDKPTKRRFKFTQHSKTEILVDSIELIAQFYNMFFIPFRLAELRANANVEVNRNWVFFPLDAFFGLYTALYSYLKPKLLIKDERNNQVMLSCRGFIKRKPVNMRKSWPDQNVALQLSRRDAMKMESDQNESIAALLLSHFKAKRSQRIRRFIARLKIYVDFLFGLVGIAFLIVVAVESKVLTLDELASLETKLTLARLPILIRSLFVIEQFLLLSTHYSVRRRNRRIEKLKTILQTNPEKATVYMAKTGSYIAPIFTGLKLLIVLTITVHWWACFGSTLQNGGVKGPLALSIEDESGPLYSYLIGFYWAITTVSTVGYGDIVPIYSFQSLWVSAAIVFGVGLYAAIVATFTLFFKKYLLDEHTFEHYSKVLRAFLYDRGISGSFWIKTMKYLSYMRTNDLINMIKVLGLNHRIKMKSDDLVYKSNRSDSLHLDQWLVDNVIPNMNSSSLSRKSLSIKVIESQYYQKLRRQHLVDITRPLDHFDTMYLDDQARSHLLYHMLEKDLINIKLFMGVSKSFLYDLSRSAMFEVFCQGDSITSPRFFFCRLYLVFKGSVRQKGSDLLIKSGQTFNETSLFLNGRIGDDTQWQPANDHVAEEFSQVWAFTRNAILRTMEMFPRDAEFVKVNYARFYCVKEALSADSERAKMAQILLESIANSKRSRMVFPLQSLVQDCWDTIALAGLIWIYLTWPVFLAFIQVFPLLPSPGSYVVDAIFLIDLWLRLWHFQLDNVVEFTSRADIARKYLKTRQAKYDIVAAIPVDIFLAMVNGVLGRSGNQFFGNPSLKTGGQISYFALFNANKLIRGTRWQYHNKTFGQRISSNALENGLKVVKVLFTLLLLSHWTACFFYLVAIQSFNSGNDLTWIIINNTGVVSPIRNPETGLAQIEPNQFANQYIHAFYFAVITLTKCGFGDITPVAAPELAFVTVVLIVGPLLYASIVVVLGEIVSASDITTTIFHMRRSLGEYLLLKYSKHPEMIKRHKDRREKLWKKQKGIQNSEIMQYLGHQLQQELFTTMLQVEYFEQCPIIGPSKTWPYFLRSMKLCDYAASETIFIKGQLCNRMYLIVKGNVQVSSDHSNNDDNKRFVSTGTCLGDNAFFDSISAGALPYKSTAQAVSAVTLLELSLADFLLVLGENLHIQKDTIHALSQRQKGHTDQENIMGSNTAQPISQENRYPIEPTRHRFVILPFTLSHIFWHALVFIVVIYNALTVPYMISGFTVKQRPVPILEEYVASARRLFPINIIADIVLALHVILSATLIAQTRQGEQIIELRALFKIYYGNVMGFLDTFTLLPIDLIIQIAAGILSVEGNLDIKVLWIFIAYCSRITKLIWLLHTFEYQRIISEYMQARFAIRLRAGQQHLIKIMICTVLVAHIGACFYTLIVLNTASGEQLELLNKPQIVDYVTNLYVLVYTITTIGYGNEIVINNAERIYLLVFAIIGLVLCDAGITSTLVNMVALADSSKADWDRVCDASDSFVGATHYDFRLPSKLATYFKYTKYQHGKSDAQLLKNLSSGCCLELKRNVLEWAIDKRLRDCTPLKNFTVGMLTTFCQRLKPKLYLPKDVIFEANQPIDKIVLLLRGNIQSTAKRFVKSTTRNEEDSSSDESIEEAEFSLSAPKNGLSWLDIGLEKFQASPTKQHDCRARVLMPKFSLGQSSPDEIQCESICETWICTRKEYEEILRLAPPIGGLSYTLQEFFDNPLILNAMTKWMHDELSDDDTLPLYLLTLQLNQDRTANFDAEQQLLRLMKRLRELRKRKSDLFDHLDVHLIQLIDEPKSFLKKDQINSLRLILEPGIQKSLNEFVCTQTFQSIASKIHEENYNVWLNKVSFFQ